MLLNMHKHNGVEANLKV